MVELLSEDSRMSEEVSDRKFSYKDMEIVL